ncbi:MAG TPA: ABC transporter ATP-binding protein [Gaiellaceae bacterium]|jgi:putative spermidine/putrescine transport system ATP-binding protein|nr:ABC transporter ATP-binding protein [Gaiellaceae bacterium]
MAYLELRELRRSFGPVVALDGIEVELDAGEFLSLLGPSGCGKTTALRLVAGFDRPDSGSIVVDGKDITHVTPSRRDMGMVFQAYSLFPNMTAEQNVEFGLRIRKNRRAARRKRVAELLELVGLGHAGKRYPHQLSGGMQQRVALARALAIEPRVLLLDEPLSALDAKVRVQLREEIRRIQTQLGITTLYVTHDQEEALSVSDHVAVMWSGRIEQMGTPSEMYGAPATPFVAEFIGTMNRLEAVVVDGTSGEVEHAGARLMVDAARGRTKGERVLVLVRPELLELEPDTNGGGGENMLAGKVLTHTFLGSVTRLKILGGESEYIADIPTARVASLSIGLPVVARVPAAGTRLLNLSEEPASGGPDSGDL